MKYIASRDTDFCSLSGRSTFFKKGVPTFCSPFMHAELIAVGIVPEEDIPEPADDGKVKEPQVPSEREAALCAAFEKIVLRNRREDFTAVGVPHLSVLNELLGWAVPGKERDATFQKWNLERSGI
jgi:hypothetical protein